MDLKSLDQSNKKIHLGLDRVKKALEELWNPQEEFEVIHIAGTNGKGSVCKFLELMYLLYAPGSRLEDQGGEFLEPEASSPEPDMAQGSRLEARQNTPRAQSLEPRASRVGKFTSPHLVSVTERISVNGVDISEEDFQRLYDVILRTQSEGSVTRARGPSPSAQDDLTEFEKITCVAFMYFKEQGVDLVILETGLGGRLDATNVCERKLATAITNIAMDHMDYLGDSLEKIRKEKEGIKREDVPHFEGEKFQSSSFPNSINGQNFLLALEIFESLNNIRLNEEEKIAVLSKFEIQSRARFNLDLEKKVLVDGAHNPAAAKELTRFINEKIPNEPKTFIIAMLDKDFEGFIEALLPCINFEKDTIIFTKVDSGRSLDPAEMVMRAFAVIARERSDRSNTGSAVILSEAKDLGSALEILRSTENDCFTVITGSLYLAGEFYASV